MLCQVVIEGRVYSLSVSSKVIKTGSTGILSSAIALSVDNFKWIRLLRESEHVVVTVHKGTKATTRIS